MNRLTRLFALLAVLALIAAACADSTPVGEREFKLGDNGLPDLEGAEVTVGIENNYLPFNYVPVGETEGTGWDYEIWAAICDLLNCQEVMTVAGWPAVIQQVGNGEIDTAADGISITDERKEIVDFSDAYMVVQQRFIVRVGDDRYSTVDDVINDPDTLVGTQVGTTNFDLAVELVGEDRISAFPQFPLAVQALISGDVDAVIIDDAAGLGYVGENADAVETVEGGLQPDPLGFIFPIGSTLVEPVNLAIAELKANGTFDRISTKYFSDNFKVTYDDIAAPDLDIAPPETTEGS